MKAAAMYCKFTWIYSNQVETVQVKTASVISLAWYLVHVNVLIVS